jgi:hypothetical protein
VEDAIGVLAGEGVAILKKLTQGELQLAHLGGADEALDLEGDLAARSLRGEEALGAEVDEHVLGADADRERVVRDHPAVRTRASRIASARSRRT